MSDTKIIRPQDGFQMKFLSSKADIVIGGSAAGVGKTFALLLEFLRHHNVKGFGAEIFRRTSPQIRSEGGLWDTSMKIFPYVGGSPKETFLEWRFANSKLKFSHLQHEKDKLNYQGAQIPLIGFDELTHFTESMFFYLLSRNRSTCGVKPYVRATCNPDPDSWVAKLVEWWIDQETGYPIPERDGKIRCFVKYGDNYIWGDTKDEVYQQAKFFIDKQVEESKGLLKPDDYIKSITFISGSIYQNVELLRVDPGYLANLLSQDEATRRSLLESNWKHVKSDRDILDYDCFKGMFDNNFEVRKKKKNRIVVDVALKGSNRLIVSYFEGRSLEDIIILDKSDGKEVLEAVKKFTRKYKVPNKRIIFDADGVGGYLDGFLPGSISFHGGAKPIPVYDKLTDSNIDENYYNLKTQLIYRLGSAVNQDKYKVSPRVAKKLYDDGVTVKQQMLEERKAFKRDKVDHDGKLRVIPKEEMKVILHGNSPDILDTMFMNEYFEISAKPTTWGMSEKEVEALDY